MEATMKPAVRKPNFTKAQLTVVAGKMHVEVTKSSNKEDIESKLQDAKPEAVLGEQFNGEW